MYDYYTCELHKLRYLVCVFDECWIYLPFAHEMMHIRILCDATDLCKKIAMITDKGYIKNFFLRSKHTYLLSICMQRINNLLQDD